MARLIAWMGIALAAAYLVFVGGSGVGIHTADVRLLTIGIAALVLGAWAAVAWQRPEWRPRSALMPAILAGLASLAIATLTSRFPRISAEYLGFAVVLAALYLLLVRLFATRFFAQRLVTLSATIFVVISVGYVVAVGIRWGAWWAALGRLAIPPLRPDYESLTFGNPANVLMIAALLAVPTLAAVGWATRRAATGSIAVVTLLGVVALLTGSRAGWLALAVAGAVAVVIFALSARDRASLGDLRARFGTARARVLLVGAGLTVVAVAVALGPSIIRRATEGGEQLRLSYVAIAMRMFGEAPISGTGLGTWVVQRIRYTEAPEQDYYIPHAHNIYVQTLSEQGLIGIAAGLVVVVLLGHLLRNAMRDPDQARRRWGLLTLIGLVYFGVHEALDLQVHSPAILFALAIPLAYLDATTPTSDGERRSLPRPAASLIPIIGVAVVAVSLAGLALQELPARASDRAVDLANAGDWAAARAPALEAAAGDPGIDAYRFTAGLVEAHAGNHEAAAAFFRTVAERTDLPEAWVNLAAEEHALGHGDAAADAIRRALRLGYQRPAITMAAGDLALRSFDTATAVEAFAAAVATAPSLAADPWWLAGPARATALPAVLEAAAARASGTRWELALLAGDAELAAQLASLASIDDFVAAWEGDVAALARLDAACLDLPTNISLLLLCARAQGHAGNVDRANELRYLANVQNGGAYAAGAELRVNPNPALGRSLEGGPAIFWGTYTYRRDTPWDVVVPSLIHLTLE